LNTRYLEATFDSYYLLHWVFFNLSSKPRWNYRSTLLRIPMDEYWGFLLFI